MRFVSVAWGVLAMCAMLGSFAGSAGAQALKLTEGVRKLPWRVAGPVGFTADVAAFPDSGAFALDVYLRLSPTTLLALLKDADQSGRVRISADLRSGFGGKRQQAEEFLDITPRDTLGEYGEVVLLRFPTRSGPQKLHVRVEDMKPKAAKLPRIGRPVRFAEVTGEFEVPAAQQGRAISDPQFVWDERAASQTPFARMGSSFIPNPDRIYGLYGTTLHIAFTAVAPGSKPWHWRAQVVDERKAQLVAAESTGVAAARLDAEAKLDLSSLPAGGYDLELSAWQEGDAKPLTRWSRFSIAWHPETWSRAPGEMQDIVHFLLDADEEEQFSRLQPGEQERWLEDFWRRRDPSPDTAVNEARDAFLGRIALANSRYGRAGLEPGMFSDMGRVFVRYGEPSEIERQVIPTGDETLRQMIQELSYTESREVGTVHQQGLGGDMRPYEVWTYEGTIPNPVESDPETHRNVRHKRLVFLFVDDHGLGDFRLRYSNE